MWSLHLAVCNSSHEEHGRLWPILSVHTQVKDEGSGYHYNAVHRWYYDTSTSMYYGGEPPTWTKVPDLPDDAKYEAMAAPAAATGEMLYILAQQHGSVQKCMLHLISSWLHLAHIATVLC